jgi:formiminoglutamase
MNIFDIINEPSKSLVHHSHDQNQDTRLGEIIKTDISEISSCQVVIVGCPQDEGVLRNNGRPGTRKAPDKIREWLYKFNYTKSIEEIGVFDLGNVKIADSLEKTHEHQYHVIKKLLEMSKKIIILGGGNDISYPDCKALADVVPNKNELLVINIDKHFDVRDMQPINSGVPYGALLREKIINPSNFVELGYIPFFNSSYYTNFLQSSGVQLYSLDEYREGQNLLESVLDKDSITDIFWGFDIDGISSRDAPGVSSSYPIGFSAEEIISIAKIAGQDTRSKVFEFTEMNPDFDIDNRTAKLVAILIYTVINELSKLR